MRRPSFSLLTRCLGSFCALGVATAQTADNPATVTVSFAEVEQIFPEGGSASTVSVELTLSNRFFAEVTIPFSINPASTATYRLADADGLRSEGDYFLEEAERDDYVFDPATLSGSITFPLGEVSRSLVVTVYNDFLADGEAGEQAFETIIFDIDQSAFIPSALGDNLTHTLIIQDDDTATGEFPEQILFERNRRYEVKEFGSVSIPLRMRTGIPEVTELLYSVSFSGPQPASAEDLSGFTYDPENSSNTEFTGVDRILISAGATVATIRISAVGDLLSEGEESFFIQLDRLSINNSNSDNDGRTFTIDSEPLEVFIIDADVSTVEPAISFDVSDFNADRKSASTLRRTESVTLPFRLSTTYPDTIYIPLSFSGTAVALDPETREGDYTTNAEVPPTSSTVDNLPDFYRTIPAGTSPSTLVSLTIVSQSNGKEAKDLTVAIGDATDALPFYVETASDGTQTKVYLELNTGVDDLASYQIQFPILPLEIGFGRPISSLNTEVADDDLFIRETRTVATESTGTIQIPIYLSNVPEASVTYTVEVFTKDGDNPATLFDFSIPAAQEGWDAQVFIGNQALESIGASIEVNSTTLANTATRSYAGNSVTVILNDDDEDPIPYDQFTNYIAGSYTGIEGSTNNFEPYEETIRLRIKKTNDSSPDIAEGFAEYAIIIRELPDIELTAAYPASQLAPGTATLNPLTGLSEATIDFHPPAALAAALNTLNQPRPGGESAEDTYLAGYKTYKMAFRSYQWDATDPNNRDPLVARALVSARPSGFADPIFEPDRLTPFYYEVKRPYGLRFPSAKSPVILVEGVERPSDQLRFENENADTLAYQDELFVPVSLFDIDPDPTIGETASGGAYRDLIPDPEEMVFTLELTNNGDADLDLARLNEAGAVRVYLSTDTLPPASSATSFFGTIYSVQEMQDGSQRTYLDLGLPSNITTGSNAIRIEYLSEDGEWILAQPAQIRQLGSEFIWIDQGPPVTWPHPKDVRMRLYRVSTTSN